MSTLPLEPTPLPPEPQFWFIKETNAERLHAISAFGFTDRQSGFLLEVLLHSGVFLERQYCQFAGIVHGQKSMDFIRCLVDRQFATPIAPGKLHRGRMVQTWLGPGLLYLTIGFLLMNSNRANLPKHIRLLAETERQFEAQVAFLREQRGPVICQSLLRCYYAENRIYSMHSTADDSFSLAYWMRVKLLT